MPFPWARYWRRAGVVFVLVLVVSLALSAIVGGGRLSLNGLLIAVVDSLVLAVVLAFPLTQPIYRGPRR